MKYVLRLYITGNTLASQHAVANLAVLCRDVLADQCDVEIIDILEDPQLAEEEKILATPTLVKLVPAPVRKVVGDLSLRERVLFGLGLMETARAAAKSGSGAFVPTTATPPKAPGPKANSNISLPPHGKDEES